VNTSRRTIEGDASPVGQHPLNYFSLPSASYAPRRYDPDGDFLRRQSGTSPEIIRPEFGARLRRQFGKQHLRNASIRGAYFYLYLYVDIWSRRILGWAVHDEQSSECAADLLRDVCRNFSIEADTAVVHQDNGAPMKGATFLATLDELGVTKSFSRPRVSDDNAHIESLFRHLKYVPSYPSHGFANIAQAAAWVARFVAWYNHEHLHSAIGFVTPNDRHHGRDIEILEKRQRLYKEAQQRNPRRWSGTPRKWDRPIVVTLNPDRTIEARPARRKQAA
jgi:putative transposase